ncbi:hypothetical protein [Roseiflexus sp.]|uniref:hypothetical protein n=1 Tax=Roseiflexus sp. TaxID=2562120 RepID=UPI002585D299|nr:hypothetical protein [Roseiflexus sp.]
MHDATLPFAFDLPDTTPFAFRQTALSKPLAPRVDPRKRRGKRDPLVPPLLTTV